MNKYFINPLFFLSTNVPCFQGRRFHYHFDVNIKLNFSILFTPARKRSESEICRQKDKAVDNDNRNLGNKNGGEKIVGFQLLRGNKTHVKQRTNKIFKYNKVIN